MKQFVITMRVLKEYPDMETACDSLDGLEGWEDCIDCTVEEMNAELAAEIIADHEVFEEEIGGTGIEGEHIGKVLDLAAFKNRSKH